MTRPRALVLRALGLGDLLTGLPALRALRRHFPDHRLVLAAPDRLRDAVLALGCVDDLLPTTAPARQVPDGLPWHGPRPDLAVDLHGDGPESRALLARLRPACLLAFDPHARLGPSPGQAPAPGAAVEPERARWCRLLAWYGIEADPDDVFLDPPGEPSPAPDAVVLHPGADAGARRWPTERWAALARELGRAGGAVVVTAGAGEAPLARRVAEPAGLPARAVLGDGADLPFARLAALVAGARAVVCGDTGPAHLAVALRTPSVTLFGPVSPALWGPPPWTRHTALWHPDPGDGVRPGDAHGDRPDPRLLRIGVREVLDALAALPPAPDRPAAAAPAPASAGAR